MSNIKAGRKPKAFHEYLIQPTSAVTHSEYMACPATAFLTYTLEAKDAINQCIKHFPKNNDSTYNKASQDSLQCILSAMLPSVMGHFETYQKYLFAGLFDMSVYLKKFDVNKFKKFLRDQNLGDIDIVRLSVYRNIGTNSIGMIIADSLSSWHSPDKVNTYFKSILEVDIFSNEDKKNLEVLWQLRHSIVHTGGTITLPDAQKTESLKHMGNKSIAFEKNFISELSRKFHSLIILSNNRIKDKFLSSISNEFKDDTTVTEKINKFFGAKSPNTAWCNQ